VESPCPCGCGRSVGFAARSIAKRAVYIASLLAVPEWMSDRAERVDTRDEWTTLLHLGQYYRNTYLAVAHAEDDALGDSRAEFSEFRKAADGWEARMLSVARRLRLQDDEWCATWRGASYQVEAGRPAEVVTVLDETVPDAPCMFCDRPAGSVEHLWPEWLRKHLTDRIETTAPDDPRRDRLRCELVRTSDRVCAACLQGWLRRLDDEVIGILPPMVTGDQIAISPRQQSVLVRWATKTAMLLECLCGDSEVPSAARGYLRRGGVHEGTQVLFGHYDGDARILTYDRDLFHDGIHDEQPVAQWTFIVGNVFAQVFADPCRDSPPEPAAPLTDALVALVPVHDETIEWPPPRSIDDTNYDLIRYGTT
jgi:hypothetical protein